MVVEEHERYDEAVDGVGDPLTLGGSSVTDPVRRALARGVRARPGLTLAPATVFVTLAFLIPIAMLLWRSIADPEFGIHHYSDALQDSSVIRIMTRTFKTAVLVMLLTLILGYPYAYVMTKVGRRMRTTLLTVLLIPFWTSIMARSFAWIAILQNNGVLNAALSAFGLPRVQLLGSETGVLIGMVQVLLPFTVLPLYATLRTIDPSLMNAAEGMGARRWQAFRIVYLPLSVPGVFAAGLLTFVMSLGFYITPDLLGSPSNSLISQLIATRVSTLLDFGSAGALAAILLLATLLAVAVGARLSRGPISNATKDR